MSPHHPGWHARHTPVALSQDGRPLTPCRIPLSQLPGHGFSQVIPKLSSGEPSLFWQACLQDPAGSICPPSSVSNWRQLGQASGQARLQLDPYQPVLQELKQFPFLSQTPSTLSSQFGEHSASHHRPHMPRSQASHSPRSFRHPSGPLFSLDRAATSWLRFWALHPSGQMLSWQLPAKSQFHRQAPGGHLRRHPYPQSWVSWHAVHTDPLYL
mmetsp:Transcript_43412/g.99117  ORF Transcript_43412/g.99117 Transcript_43412/m.99117 type:complete len:212 (-) Transcript_43412:268-903(-)